MFNIRFKYPIAIDIGDQDIYAVQLKKTRQGFAVKELVHRGIDEEAAGIPDARNDLAPLFKEIVKRRRFLGKRAVVHLPSRNIYSFPIRFQVNQTETIEEAILRESKNSLPFPIEEAVIDYPSITSHSSGDTNIYKATIIAARRDYIEQYLLMLKQAGLIVEAIDFGVSSLIRLHNYLFNASPRPVILCNIGYTQSLISIVAEGSILAQRDVPWAMQILLRKILTNLDLSSEEDKAKIFLKNYGLLYEDRESPDNTMISTEDTAMDDRLRTVYQIITPYIEELIHEFHELIGYVRSERQDTVFECIYMYGYATLVRHLDRYLEKRLDIPTKLINPMTKMKLSDHSLLPDISEGAPFALALGLAMRKVTWL